MRSNFYPPNTFSSLNGLLRARARQVPDKWAYTFLSDGEAPGSRLTYSELALRARNLAARLQGFAAPGDRALLLYPPGIEFIVAFFGCLDAGLVPVPAYPPSSKRTLPRLVALAENARPVLALSVSSHLRKYEALAAAAAPLAALRWIGTDSPGEESGSWYDPGVTEDSLAFLQYTSGSTAAPKGVEITHGNLLHNEEMIRLAFGQSQESVIVGWLPLYHDMGLIGNVLQPLYLGASCYFMSPVAFLQNPRRWLQALSRYRATTSGAPNFAYELCVRRIASEGRAGLDLSSWKVAFNGAEPLRGSTLERFAETFGPCGFSAEAFHPCYGLAEGTLLVSAGDVAQAPRVEIFDHAALEEHAVRLSPAESAGGGRSVVGCGRPRGGQRVIIVDPETRELCAADRVGEIWVAGPSVARGYWQQPEVTREVFEARLASGEGPFLRTGDLGFLEGGELFVTGRRKDLIIVRGRNHYPQDLELTAEGAHLALRSGCGAAFSVEAGGEERLVLVHEVYRRTPADPQEVTEAVRRALAQEHGIELYELVLLRTGTLPKTSSGKVRRRACREAYLGGNLTEVGRGRSAEPAAEDEGRAEESWELTAFDPAQRKSVLEGLLRCEVARMAAVEPAAVDPGQPLASLGLDSLRTVELRARIEERLDTRLPASSVLPGEASIERLAEEALGAAETRSEGAGKIVPAGEPTGEHPLSHSQRALWFLSRLAPESAAYNIAAAARLVGELEPRALRRSFEHLVRRHPALRTRFAEAGGEPVQIVPEEAAAEFDWAVEDAGSWEESALCGRLAEAAFRPFDLERDALLRVRLYRRGAGEHFLLLAVHHTVADLWSLVVLLADLDRVHAAGSGGAPPRLEPLELSYADYVDWQARFLQSEAAERARAYWCRRLAAIPESYDLPTDRPRPPVQTYRGAVCRGRLARGLGEALHATSRAQGVTPYMFLTASYLLLLRRYAAQDAVVVGSPVSGRTHSSWHPLVGYFVNSLALCGDLSGDPSFGEFLDRVRRTVLDAFRYQDYPFELVVEHLAPERDPSRPPLFQVMFSLQQVPGFGSGQLGAFALGRAGSRLRLAGLEWESIELPQKTSQVDLHLMTAWTDRGLETSLQYNTDLWDTTTARRFLEHFEKMVAGAVDGSEVRLSTFEILGVAERHQILVEASDTAAPHGRGAAHSVHALFEAQARRTPDGVALIHGEARLSYGELGRRVGRLADHLGACGVAPEVRAGIFLDRSPQLVVALLGVMKAGGAYVPLDPTYPSERLALLLEDARQGGEAMVVLTRQGLAQRLPEGVADRGIRIVRLDRDVGPRRSFASPAPAVGSNLAYVIYTSGSTGRPKGVAIEHRSAVALLEWARDVFAPQELAGVFASTSINFDLSVFEIFAPLAWGGTVVLAENALSLAATPAAVSLLNTVPSAIAELVRVGAVPPSVRTVNLAGEALKRTLAQRVYELPQVKRLLNLYGPSEDTTYSTLHEVGRREPREPSIGRPIAATRGYISDRRMRPVALGVSGELWLAGAGLARGYLHRPRQSAERFVPDPFGERPGERLYRTGDLACRRVDGQIEFLGRIDHQVKVRGFRIELGEIEAVLARHPSLREAVVLVRELAGDRQLVAYGVPEGGERPDADELRRHLADHLPSYMVPAFFVILEADLPLTPNGKVDRKALSRMAVATVDRRQDLAVARTQVEKTLADLCSEVLGIRQVGMNDHFFRLGGHSLLAVKLTSLVRHTFGIDLAVESVFEAPRLADLAAVIEAAVGTGHAVEPITSVPRGGDLPLSFAQEQLWFLHRLEPESPAYNMPGALRLSGRLDVVALRCTLAEILRRHEVLRVRFIETEEEAVQRIGEVPTFLLPIVDLAGLSEARRPAKLRALLREEARRPFELEHGPALRASLLRLGEEEHVMLLTLHHIVSDEGSLNILLREIRMLYRAFAAGRSSPLAELPIGYADYAVWQRQRFESGALEPQVSYWKRRLAGELSSCTLPVDASRPPAPGHGGARRTFALSPELSAAVEELSRREGVTLFMTLLAAFKVLLHRTTGNEDIVVGTAADGRHRAEVEPLIGLFVNMLVLRTDLGASPCFRELLHRVREVVVGAFAHQEVPFEKLVNELRKRRGPADTPLFQVAFGLREEDSGPPDLPQLEVEIVTFEEETVRFDLTVWTWRTAAGLHVGWRYRSDLFSHESIEQMQRRFEFLLEQVTERPDVRISMLELASPAEVRQQESEKRELAALHTHKLTRARRRPVPIAKSVA